MLRPENAPPARAATHAALVLVLLAAFPACRGSDPGQPVSTLTTDEFIAVVVEIREAERKAELSDSAQALFEEQKREILDRHGTSEDELRRFLADRGEDIDFLRELWDTLNHRLRHIPEQRDAEEAEGIRLLEDQ
jgi:hypothetical protein